MDFEAHSTSTWHSMTRMFHEDVLTAGQMPPSLWKSCWLPYCTALSVVPLAGRAMNPKRKVFRR